MNMNININELRERLIAAASAEKKTEILKNSGIRFSEEEIEKIVAFTEAEGGAASAQMLHDEELKTVTGGTDCEVATDSGSVCPECGKSTFHPFMCGYLGSVVWLCTSCAYSETRW